MDSQLLNYLYNLVYNSIICLLIIIIILVIYNALFNPLIEGASEHCDVSGSINDIYKEISQNQSEIAIINHTLKQLKIADLKKSLKEYVDSEINEKERGMKTTTDENYKKIHMTLNSDYSNGPNSK